MPRRKQKTIKLGPKAMSELFKPMRLEVYESLQVSGPASIADLALRLGRPADSLYYHVKKLLAIGVVEEWTDGARPRSGPGRKGALFVVTKRIDVDLDPKSRRSREAWAEGGAAVLRLAQRDYARTLDSGDIRPDGKRRNLAMQRAKVRVSPAELKQLNEQIDALRETMLKYTENTEGELHAVTYLLTPLEESQR